MAHIKYTQEGLEKLVSVRNKLMARLGDFKAIADGEKSDFWKKIRVIVMEKLDGVEEKLDSHESLTPDQKTIFLTERKCYRFFSRLPQDFSAGLTYLNRQISDQNERIAEYKKRLHGR